MNNAQTQHTKAYQSRIIGICSGGSSVGKTWLGLSLCKALAQQGKKVLFFDADCGLNNAAAQLSLGKTPSYAALLSGALTLNNAINRLPDLGFDLITAPSGEEKLFQAPFGRLQLLAQDLCCFSNFYDVVIIDCGCKNPLVENLFLKHCAEVLLVTNPDSASLTANYQKMQTLFNLELKNTGVVINQVNSVNEGQEIFKTIIKSAATLIGLNVTEKGSICRDSRIRESVESGAIFLSRYPDCESARQIQKLSAVL